MFGRRALQRQAEERRVQQLAVTAQQEIELAHLRDRVQRLEQALAQLIDASDDVLVASPQFVTSSFAAAWSEVDANRDPDDDKFFSDGPVDQRARRWLLTSP